jgi:hypothetical protein
MLVKAITRIAHRLLLGPNGRPLPSQRSCMENIAITQVKMKVGASTNASRDMRYSMLSPPPRHGNSPKA